MNQLTCPQCSSKKCTVLNVVTNAGEVDELQVECSDCDCFWDELLINKGEHMIDKCCECGKRGHVNVIKDTVIDGHDYGEWSKPIQVTYLVCSKCLNNDGGQE